MASNMTSDLVTRLRTKMKHSAAYSVRENEERLVALGTEAADEIERLTMQLDAQLKWRRDNDNE